MSMKPLYLLLSAYLVTGCQLPNQSCEAGFDDSQSRAVAVISLDNLPTTFSMRTNLVGATLAPENQGLLVTKTSQTAYRESRCDGEIRTEFLMITTLGSTNQPRALGQIDVSYIEAGRGGFSSLDAVAVTPDSSASYPRFEITQTTLPADGDADFRPGPPTTVVYCFRDEQYQTGEVCRTP